MDSLFRSVYLSSFRLGEGVYAGTDPTPLIVVAHDFTKEQLVCKKDYMGETTRVDFDKIKGRAFRD